MQNPFVKILAVGDSVGKTCLFTSFIDKKFPSEYVPTVTDANSQDLSVDGRVYNFTLVDVASRDEESRRLRTIAYQHTNVFVLCFSVVDRNSFDNVSKEWSPELATSCPEIPVLLVGTKIDLREDGKIENVSFEEGKSKAKEINAFDYLECSAMTQKGLKEVITEAIRASQNGSKTEEKKKKDCTIS